MECLCFCIDIFLVRTKLGLGLVRDQEEHLLQESLIWHSVELKPVD